MRSWLGVITMLALVVNSFFIGDFRGHSGSRSVMIKEVDTYYLSNWWIKNREKVLLKRRSSARIKLLSSIG